jgi:hypothetical protein
MESPNELNEMIELALEMAKVGDYPVFWYMCGRISGELKKEDPAYSEFLFWVTHYLGNLETPPDISAATAVLERLRRRERRTC